MKLDTSARLLTKKDREMKSNFINTLFCAKFHYIRTIEEIKFIDKVDGRAVGQFECVKCGIKFMANKKRSIFRVKN
jgi:hypothetical protein